MQGIGYPSVHQPFLHQGEAERTPGLCQELALSVAALEAETPYNLTPNRFGTSGTKSISYLAGVSIGN